MKKLGYESKFLFPTLFLILFSGCQMKRTAQKYQERYRPQYHFTPESHWMNDPNGMFFYEGEYHLFYQHYPKDIVWGPMHWGHAVSKDLLHWEQLPIALYPDSLGYIFSGSAVVDWKNTSGLGTAENPPIVALYTYHDPIGEQAQKNDFQTQGLAYSLDRGRSWKKYQNNPVLQNPGIRDFRDPKVFWHETSKHWIMSLAVQDHIAFYRSPNLIEWEALTTFGKDLGAHGGVWECPDLFPLNDQNGNEKWVLLVSINPGGPYGGSATQYFIGDFDGKTFTPQDTQIRWMDFGSDNYAGVTYSDIPTSDGRKILIGWMSNWDYANQVPTETWRSAMTLPRTLSLHQTADQKFELRSAAIDEMSTILGTEQKLDPQAAITLLAQETQLYFEVAPDSDWSVTLSNAVGEFFAISQNANTIRIDRTQSSNNSFSDAFAKTLEIPLNRLKVENLTLYLDRSSIELFVNENALVSTNLIFPTQPFNQLLLKNISAGHQKQIERVWK